MECQLYSVRDKKANAIIRLFHSINLQVANRIFASMAVDLNSMQSLYPDDYEMYMCGTIDMTTGIIHGSDSPEYCANLMQIINAEGRAKSANTTKD